VAAAAAWRSQRSGHDGALAAALCGAL
jgi:hypothetical protein